MQNGMSAAQVLDGAVETTTELQHIPKLTGLNLKAVERGKENGESLVGWLRDNLDKNRDALFYLLGNSDANKLLRNYLKEQHVPGGNIVTTKYWTEGKTGL
jgi:NADPH-dependent ferric siderophore reductase